MKTQIRMTGVLFGWIGMILSLLSPWSALADLEVSGSVSIHATAEFHAPLAAHGTWIEVGSYGRCWRPASVAVEWRPYCEGHWVWTDCGWFWASDEPWGWACYHYGSWVHDTGYGWVWVPGVEWAPAWVSWRVGGGYFGWAPLGPPGFVVAPSMFVFVESHRFREPIRPRTVIVNNTTIINRTTVINNIRSETRTVAGTGSRKVMVNEGPGTAPIEQATKQKVQRVAINEAARQAPPPATLAKPGTTRENAPATEQKGEPRDKTKVPVRERDGTPTKPATTTEPQPRVPDVKQPPTQPPQIAPKPTPSEPVQPRVPTEPPKIPPQVPRREVPDVTPSRPVRPEVPTPSTNESRPGPDRERVVPPGQGPPRQPGRPNPGPPREKEKPKDR